MSDPTHPTLAPAMLLAGQRVYVLTLTRNFDHNPGWEGGVYSSIEKAKSVLVDHGYYLSSWQDCEPTEDCGLVSAIPYVAAIFQEQIDMPHSWYGKKLEVKG